MRIIYFGTPEIAASQLEAILNAGYDVPVVVTTPDRPAGRGKQMHSSEVKECALRHGLPVLQPERLKDEAFLEQLRSYNADLFVVVAFRMLPEAVWSMPPKAQSICTLLCCRNTVERPPSIMLSSTGKRRPD